MSRLAHWPGLRRVTHLDLRGNGLSGPDLAALTASPYLEGLTSLELSGNRLNDAATVALNGGTLNVLGSGSASSSETLGPVGLVGGNSTVFTQAGPGLRSSAS